MTAWVFRNNDLKSSSHSPCNGWLSPITRRRHRVIRHDPLSVEKKALSRSIKRRRS